MLAPVLGIQRVLAKAGWSKEDPDLYELNEAFSVQALGVMKEVGMDPAKVNVNGGAVAIGHPIGASGARILVALIYEMMRRDVAPGSRGPLSRRRQFRRHGSRAISVNESASIMSRG